MHSKQGPRHVVELHLGNIDALFERQHVNPFKQPQALDSGMQQLYRRLWLEPRRGVLLKLYLPETALKDVSTGQIRDAIGKYCTFMKHVADNHYRMLLLEGLRALPVGIFFLGLCLTLALLIQELDIFPHLARFFVKEGLYIIGWVGMWKPMEIFLYEWWPFRRQMRVYRCMSELEISLEKLPGNA